MITKLKIGPFVYKIQPVEQLTRTDEDNSQFLLLGDIDYANLKIRIDTSKKLEVQYVTLLHESIHGMLANAGFPSIEQDKLEQIIDIIAIGFFQMTKDNKSFRDLIGTNFKTR